MRRRRAGSHVGDVGEVGRIGGDKLCRSGSEFSQSAMLCMIRFLSIGFGIEQQSGRCVSREQADAVYVAGRNFVTTHNNDSESYMMPMAMMNAQNVNSVK